MGWLFSLIFWDVNSLQFCSWGGYFQKFRAPTARFPLEYTTESKKFAAPSARLIFYSFSTRKLVQNSQNFPPPSAAVGCLLSLTFWDSNFFRGVIRFGCFGHQFGRGALIRWGVVILICSVMLFFSEWRLYCQLKRLWVLCWVSRVLGTCLQCFFWLETWCGSYFGTRIWDFELRYIEGHRWQHILLFDYQVSWLHS